MSTCSNCDEYYDFNEHLPKMCINRHTICKHCVQNIMITGGFQCPQNCEVIQGNNPDLVPNDEAKISELKKSHISCFKCNEARAFFFNLESLEALCINCDGKTTGQDPNIIKSSINKIYIQKYIEFKHTISFEMKNYMKNILVLNVETKLHFINSLMSYFSTSNKCAVHPQRYCESLKSNTFKLCCSECNPGGLKLTEEPYNSQIGNQIKIYKGKKELMIGSILRLYENIFPTNYWSVLIEAYLMVKHTPNIKEVSCMFCGKGFCVGERMPYKMTCGHLICKSCSVVGRNCYMCKTPSLNSEVYLDQDLYEIPKCKSCLNSSDISLKNLPYHFFCKHIVCGNCVVLGHNTCNECFDVTDPNFFYQYRLKVHKRLLNTLRYLDVNLKCFSCSNRRAEFLSNSIASCETCSRADSRRYPISSTFEFDTKLITYYKSYFPNIFFESQPLNSKILLISNLYSNRNTDPKDLVKYSEFKELNRFKLIYPINNQDLRSYLASNYFRVRVNISSNVKVFGLKLAGKTDFSQVQVQVWILSTQNETIFSASYYIRGKVDYVHFESVLELSEFDIVILYQGQCQVFTGKAAISGVYRKDGITFTFSDPNIAVENMRGTELYGPITGILYSV